MLRFTLARPATSSSTFAAWRISRRPGDSVSCRRSLSDSSSGSGIISRLDTALKIYENVIVNGPNGGDIVETDLCLPIAVCAVTESQLDERDVTRLSRPCHNLPALLGAKSSFRRVLLDLILPQPTPTLSASQNVPLGRLRMLRFPCPNMLKLTRICQYRPKSLDELHYHEGLSARLRSLVRYPRYNMILELRSDVNFEHRLRLEISHTCSSTDHQGQARRRG